MKLFIIPSWYPSTARPNSGIFILEQAEALASLSPDIRVMVSTWQQDGGSLPIRILKRVVDVLAQTNNSAFSRIAERKGVHEIFSPALTWSERLPRGGVRTLLSAHRGNLELAAKVFGKPDLIHAHVSYPAGFIASVLSKELHIPYLLTEHMGPFPFASMMRNGRPITEIDQAFASASATIAVSPALAESISAFYSKPHVIPNLVNETAFIPAQPSPGKFRFLTVCSLTDQKGVDDLLRAIARWDPSPDQVEFRICGDGPMRAHYEIMARRLRIADRVTWLGMHRRDMIPTLFQESHVFVMPSRHESFGVVFAEAIASGKPIIATCCGGPEYIVNECNGLLVRVGDLMALSAAMQQLKHNWASYDPQAIRLDFMQRFSRPAVIKQLLAVYERILQ